MNQETQKNRCPKAALALGGLMVAIAATLVGGYGASQLTANYMLNQYVERDTRTVRKQITALRMLQAGDSAQAIELLESQLDDQLVLFDPQRPYEGLDERTRQAVQQAVADAKTYRAEFPRSSSRPHVDEMVRNLFRKTDS